MSITPTTKTIEEVTETLIDYRGKTPPKTNQGVRLVTAKVIKEGFVQDERREYISPDFYDTWMRRGLPHKWDILITTEAPLGEVAQLRTNEKVALAQRVILLRGDPKVIDQSFYFHALKSPLVQNQLRQRSSGTTVYGIKQSELRQVAVPYYPLAIQRKIAWILSAYDDLFDNNIRRVRILEDMARTIFTVWFVKLRFPGYDGVPSLNSKNGNIPEGWELTTLDSVLAELESGSRPAGGVGEIDEGVPSIGAENILGLGQYDYGTEKFVSRDFYESMRRGHVKSGDVLLYKDGAKIGRKSLFRDGFPHETCCVNEHVFILRSNDHCAQSYLYFWFDQPKITQDIRNLNANAAQPGINQQSVRSLPILLPPIDLVTAFDQTIEPVLALLFDLAKKNRLLQQARDALLTRLVSGELAVSDLEIKVEDGKT